MPAAVAALNLEGVSPLDQTFNVVFEEALPSGAYVHDYVIDSSAESAFDLTWSSGTMSLSLTDPLGTTVDQSVAATDPDIEALDNAKTPTETYQLTDHVLYLHAPDGIGRSKLAANAEKHLGVVTTARNYRTVEKLLSMATQTDP